MKALISGDVVHPNKTFFFRYLEILLLYKLPRECRNKNYTSARAGADDTGF